MRGLPWSLSFFVFTGVIYLLQLFPFTGIFLMFLLAPFWSVVTINLGFIFLALEAAFGSVPRLWLALPALYFGGYALAANESANALRKLDAEIHAHNATQSLAFDPGGGALVVQEDADAIGGLAAALVQRYRLPVVYTTPARQTRRRNDLAAVTDGRALRLADAQTCRRMRSERASAARIYVNTSRKADTCLLGVPEEPGSAIWRIEAKAERLANRLVKGKLVHITISAPDGRTVTLRTGHAAALTRLPLPVMGCALNSGAPSWQCDAGFSRGALAGLGAPGAYGAAAVDVVARALRLAAREASSAAPASPDAESALEAAVTRHEDTALANLDRVLADPTIRATVHDLWGLHQRPQVLVERADRMLGAMSNALAHGRGASETARNLQRLISALPDADFERVGPDLLRRLEDGRPPNASGKRRPVPEQIDGFLTPRLGTLGAAALPLLERLALAARPDAPAILGLCHMGTPAAHLAERLAQHVRASTRHTSEARAATYVTLVRWGRVDLGEELLEPDNRDWQRRNYAGRWPGLTPGAGAEVCTLRHRA